MDVRLADVYKEELCGVAGLVYSVSGLGYGGWGMVYGVGCMVYVV